MKIDDKTITDTLIRIRKSIGADEKEFIPRPPPDRVDVELGGKSVTSLFDPSGLLIQDGRPVFAYIRDHIGHFADDPYERKKIHFTVCQTLTAMKTAGRWERYQVTNRDDNQYLVDVSIGGNNSEERLVTLYPCQHCLDKVGYRCFDSATKEQRLGIVKSFDAKTALSLLWQRFDIFRLQVKGLRSAASPAGYAKNHREISRAYRAKKKFICEDKECGVDLKHKPRLTDAHHIDHKKWNNPDENLQCLCKLCHAKKHSHYRVSESDRREIENARRLQNIPASSNMP